MQSCHLLNLPAELRNKIYLATLSSLDPIQISERSRLSPGTAKATTTHYDRVKEPAFLQTCTQIRYEALAIFYGENIFFTAIRDALPVWLKAIGPEKTQLIRCIRGFRPWRFFDHQSAKKFIGNIEAFLEAKGCALPPGVFSVPFAHEEFEEVLFWANGNDQMVVEGREGEIGRVGRRRRVSVKGGRVAIE